MLLIVFGCNHNIFSFLCFCFCPGYSFQTFPHILYIKNAVHRMQHCGHLINHFPVMLMMATGKRTLTPKVTSTNTNTNQKIMVISLIRQHSFYISNVQYGQIKSILFFFSFSLCVFHFLSLSRYMSVSSMCSDLRWCRCRFTVSSLFQRCKGQQSFSVWQQFGFFAVFKTGTKGNVTRCIAARSKCWHAIIRTMSDLPKRIQAKEYASAARLYSY